MTELTYFQSFNKKFSRWPKKLWFFF